MMRISIIGTAGRKEDGAKLSWAIYQSAFHRVKDEIDCICPIISERELVSGGAAWMDHLAISLFLSGFCDKLTLYLPDEFIFDGLNSRYKGSVSPHSHPGDVANYYHGKFSKHVPDQRNTMAGISLAKEHGADMVVIPGFKERNIYVGQSDVLIAFTFGEGNIPKDGGTSHTWDNSTAQTKVHISLKGIV